MYMFNYSYNVSKLVFNTLYKCPLDWHSAKFPSSQSMHVVSIRPKRNKGLFVIYWPITWPLSIQLREGDAFVSLAAAVNNLLISAHLRVCHANRFHHRFCLLKLACFSISLVNNHLNNVCVCVYESVIRKTKNESEVTCHKENTIQRIGKAHLDCRGHAQFVHGSRNSTGETIQRNKQQGFVRQLANVWTNVGQTWLFRVYVLYLMFWEGEGTHMIHNIVHIVIGLYCWNDYFDAVYDETSADLISAI